MAKGKRVLIAGVGMYDHERIEFAMIQGSYKMVALVADASSVMHAEKLRDTYQPKGIKFVIKQVDPEDYMAILSTTLTMIQDECKGYSPVFYVGLGTRFVTLALSQAAFLTESDMFLVTITDHETRQPKDIREIPTLPTLSLTKAQLTMLDVLYNSENGMVKSLKDLSKRWRDAMEMASLEQTSSASKLVKKLMNWGLVERRVSESSGRVREVYITELGKTVRAWKGLKKTEH
ncbi:MAG: hypothetical protein JW779_10450 [Candidatus Thorarchaeota archaeon]|nr:hypothetical protein [Candidatus Thorarchaeota archaeon]